MSNEVVHNHAEGRYELTVDGQRALTAYRLDDNIATFLHTEVPATLEGRGVGTRLIAGALADERSRGWTVRPTCPFVARYFEKHPELGDMLA